MGISPLSFVFCFQICYPGRFLFVTVLKVLKVNINNRLFLNAGTMVFKGEVACKLKRSRISGCQVTAGNTTAFAG